MRYFIFYYDGYSLNGRNRYIGTSGMIGNILPSQGKAVENAKKQIKDSTVDIWITGFNEVTEEDYFTWYSK